MADNERELLENLATLPKPVRDEFLSQLQGAAAAVKALGDVAKQEAQEAEDGS